LFREEKEGHGSEELGCAKAQRSCKPQNMKDESWPQQLIKMDILKTELQVKVKPWQ
jgi:hypothetical protein